VLLNLAHVAPTGGTGVYARELARALRELGHTVDEARAGHRYTNLAAEAAWQLRLARRARGYDVLHHLLPALGPTREGAPRGRAERHAAGVPQVVTVHDLAFVRVPECFNARYRCSALLRHRRAARGAAVVICPSEATAADARSRWSPAHVVVAPHGPGQAPAHDRGEPRHFLYVGDDEPRKNLARLREAHATAATGLGLEIVGRAGRSVDARELGDLHRHAAALVVPSLHEGFGLTALEAMHAGTPVLAARTSGLAEVCGEAARYCNPYDVADIAHGLTELATVGPLREELRRRGLARASGFSWERSALAHAEAYTLACDG
jgi:alpha-1,3-rhamnosyl/mannosyltransferase